MQICVYLGSREGKDPRFVEATEALGAAIAARGWGLVYGGARNGLMGRLANACLAGGGEVIGVMPEHLVQREVSHQSLTRLIRVDSMHERKAAMAAHADAFIALPGGIGTLEELFEIWTWRYLTLHDKPLGVLNVADFYSPLLTFLDTTVEHGFLDASTRRTLIADADIESLLDRLAQSRQA
ncbi:LOG family protein [Salinicola rhizosphaerae]|uniref:Cytokinin riboside 5'-monophosphate phosphoribohydrolase n=1 Tax=Salinicola rhizosphaerae TaxID=1443141 RepID=A0ABQ3DUY4_9GAMM|nr:TIGR00730 family Rossman fold protein [Salinicola rhizosphaerae]GHB17233.1 cytokinin riboside 5'-monophosphate phosphoribohydrolase [Salinicola rhizosphaerae]